jgi:hypothetical protein
VIEEAAAQEVDKRRSDYTARISCRFPCTAGAPDQAPSIFLIVSTHFQGKANPTKIAAGTRKKQMSGVIPYPVTNPRSWALMSSFTAKGFSSRTHLPAWTV